MCGTMHLRAVTKVLADLFAEADCMSVEVVMMFPRKVARHHFLILRRKQTPFIVSDL